MVILKGYLAGRRSLRYLGPAAISASCRGPAFSQRANSTVAIILLCIQVALLPLLNGFTDL